MNELIERIILTMNQTLDEMQTFGNKGIKAAGLRARKKSLELEKLLKEFRKESVKA